VSVTRKGNSVGGKAAIVGIGATEFSKDSGRSEMSLASEAVAAAIADAGLTPAPTSSAPPRPPSPRSRA